MGQRLLRTTLIFLVIYLGVSFFLPNPNQKDELSQGDIGLKMVSTEIAQGNLVRVNIQNNTDHAITLGDTQNPPEKLIFERRENGQWVAITTKTPEPLSEPIILQAHEKREFSWSEFNTELFFEPGDYRVSIHPTADQEFSAEFQIFEPGFFRTLFRAVYKVIYNTFILLLMVSGGSLGFAIILITLIIKLLLWGFNQKSLESQQKMQKIQPELKALREKYKNDQQRLASETMALWKKYKVNPFATLTPILVQFPVLIALFYVIREGLLPHNHYLLYPPLQHFDFSQINQMFLGIFNLANHPLNDKSLLWLPIVVGISQFIAMKLSFKRAEKKKLEAKKAEPKADKKAPSIMDQMEGMNKTMLYIFPGMIFFFTLTFPAGVGLYWWISTLIGIGQQYLVNKKLNS